MKERFTSGLCANLFSRCTYVPFNDEELTQPLLIPQQSPPEPRTTSAKPMSEDDIDAAALQARIDISMSFANDLVSSWIKTPKKAQPDRPWAEIQREMDEYARRPPR